MLHNQRHYNKDKVETIVAIFVVDMMAYDMQSKMLKGKLVHRSQEFGEKEFDIGYYVELEVTKDWTTHTIYLKQTGYIREKLIQFATQSLALYRALALKKT